MPALTSIVAVAGAGALIGGVIGGSATAKKQAAEQKAIAADQIKIEQQKRMAMELDSRRRELEVFRNVQRAKSIALTNATLQGAGQSSGLIGGTAQATASGQENLESIGQNLILGRTISDLNNDISSHKMTLADLGADASMYSGISQIGSTLLGNVGTIGKLTSGWGNTSTSA
jgi:hypothetical protein